MMCNMCMARNLATLRENICVMLSHASGTLALCYTVEVYRNINLYNIIFIFSSIETFFRTIKNLNNVKNLNNLDLINFIIFLLLIK